MHLELFEQTILSSLLFSRLDPTVNGYANQMETELTSILDEVVPLFLASEYLSYQTEHFGE